MNIEISLLVWLFLVGTSLSARVAIRRDSSYVWPNAYQGEEKAIGPTSIDWLLGSRKVN